MAQTKLQELNNYKSQIEQYQQWQRQWEDSQAIVELLELEPDQSLFNEA